MSLKAGIVGLPNVGKSTLFNAVTNQRILAANYPFATIDPNIGVVLVPDERLEVINKYYETTTIIPTSYEFTDIAGLVKGASKGEGLGNKFLSHIREVDAIVEVVRCFSDPNIIHVENDVDPIRDIEIIDLELSIADLEIVNNRIERIRKRAEATKEHEVLVEYGALKKAKEALEAGKAIRTVEFSDEEALVVKSFNFLTAKPIIFLANVSEEDLTQEDNEHVKRIKKYVKNLDAKVIKLSVKLEEELSDVDAAEKKEILEAVGIKESGLDSLIKETYDLLGLDTFFTAGEIEVRAWTFKRGSSAKKCAGIIHSDFERGFIRAEVMSYDDLVKYGSETKVKEAGRLRLEGKDYLMQDGDICHFRFNV